MNNGLIIDAVFALVLILGVVFGAKRGLFRSLMGLVTVVAALIGATLLADALVQPVTDALTPRAEKSVQEWFDTEAPAPQGDAPETKETSPAENGTQDASLQDGEAARQDEPALAVSGFLKRLLRFDLDGAVRESLRRSAQDAALAAVRSLLASVVRTLVFVLSFLVLMLVLRLLTRGLDRVFGLPVLHTLNSLGGGALGLIESALLLFLICDLAPKLGVTIFDDYEGGAYLLAFFMQQTPRSAAAALLP